MGILKVNCKYDSFAFWEITELLELTINVMPMKDMKYPPCSGESPNVSIAETGNVLQKSWLERAEKRITLFYLDYKFVICLLKPLN